MNWLAMPEDTAPRIRRWAAEHTDLIRLIERPTWDGHAAFAVTVAAPGGGDRPGALVEQAHAHEPAATAGMMRFLGKLLDGQDADGEQPAFDRQAVLAGVELTLIPDGNPDGRARSPEPFWDGSAYTNDAFLKIAFGTAPDGERFPRQGRWSTTEQSPARLGIVYERIGETEYVEPNRDPDSTYARLVRTVLGERRVGRILSLHQTEFERSEHNCEVLLPFCQADLPADVAAENVRWGRAVVEAWRAAGGMPRPEPRPLVYGEGQLRYFRACWRDVYERLPWITVEVQNNNPRTSPHLQRRLEELAIETTATMLAGRA